MKIDLVYLWFLTSFIFYFVNIGAGLALTLASIVIVIQNNQIKELTKRRKNE